jgi:hypothetical protein
VPYLLAQGGIVVVNILVILPSVIPLRSIYINLYEKLWWAGQVRIPMAIAAVMEWIKHYESPHAACYSSQGRS